MTGDGPAAVWRAGRLAGAAGLPSPTARKEVSALGTDGYQAHDVSRELVARYAAAFVELETPGALAALESTARH